MASRTDSEYEIAHSKDEAAGMKKSAASTEAATAWRADLWANAPAAITWANSPPLSQAGTIEFNVRDNGQVWTFTLL